MCEDMHDSSAISTNAASGLRLQIPKGFRAWMVKFTRGRNVSSSFDMVRFPGIRHKLVPPS
jgi:hypothetical protein